MGSREDKLKQHEDEIYQSIYGTKRTHYKVPNRAMQKFVTGIVPPNGGTWQEFVDGLDDAATPAKYNHHWS